MARRHPLAVRQQLFGENRVLDGEHLRRQIRRVVRRRRRPPSPPGCPSASARWRAGNPSPSMNEDLTGIPMTGSVVWPAITPARCAALPCRGDDRPQSRFRARSPRRTRRVSGVLCALATWTSTSISHPLQDIDAAPEGRPIALRTHNQRNLWHESTHLQIQNRL